jgi:hypothetical protein
MKMEGYVSSGRNFTVYLARVLRESGQFNEDPFGRWALI